MGIPALCLHRCRGGRTRQDGNRTRVFYARTDTGGEYLLDTPDSGELRFCSEPGARRRSWRREASRCRAPACRSRLVPEGGPAGGHPPGEGGGERCRGVGTAVAVDEIGREAAWFCRDRDCEPQGVPFHLPPERWWGSGSRGDAPLRCLGTDY